MRLARRLRLRHRPRSRRPRRSCSPHDQRRDEADHLTPRAAGQQQQPAPGRLLLDGGGRGAVGFAVGVAELVADHQAEAAHVGDLLVLVRDGLQRLLQLGAALGGVLDQLLVAGSRRGWRGRPRRRPRWRRRCRPASRARPSPSAPTEAAMPDSGKPDASPFAVTRMSAAVVVEMVAAPELAGPAEAGLHLVDHQQDPVRVGALAQARRGTLGSPARSRPRRAPARRRTRRCRPARSRSAACSRAGASANSVACSTGQPKWPGSGNGETCTPRHQRAEAGAELGAGGGHRAPPPRSGRGSRRGRR